MGTHPKPTHPPTPSVPKPKANPVLFATVIISATLGPPMILVALANTLRWEGLANPLFWLTIFGTYGMAHALVGLHLPARRTAGVR